MPKTIIGIQARLTSTRFPRKVLAEIAPGLTVLKSCIHGCLDSGLPVVLLIPDTPENDELFDMYQYANLFKVFRGPEDDVLKRYVLMAESEGLEPDDYIVRITSDCPFTDGEMIADMVRISQRLKLNYLSNVHVRTFPKGMDVEVIKFNALRLHEHYVSSEVKHYRLSPEQIKGHQEYCREHVTQCMTTADMAINYYNNGTKYPTDPDIRWTVDTPEDLEACKAEYQRRHPVGCHWTGPKDGLTILSDDEKICQSVSIDTIDGKPMKEYFENLVDQLLPKPAHHCTCDEYCTQAGINQRTVRANPDQVNRQPRETKV